MARSYRVVRDETSGVTLADRAWVADSSMARFRGLMLRTELPGGEGLTIEPCGSIHMLLMRMRIDAVFYSRAGVVTNVARNLRPWTSFSMGRHGVFGVLELPAGVADAVDKGHQLSFSEVRSD